VIGLDEGMTADDSNEGLAEAELSGADGVGSDDETVADTSEATPDDDIIDEGSKEVAAAEEAISEDMVVSADVGAIDLELAIWFAPPQPHNSRRG